MASTFVYTFTTTFMSAKCVMCIGEGNIILEAWYFNKMVLQNTLRSDVSAILKSSNVLEIVREFEVVKQ